MKANIHKAIVLIAIVISVFAYSQDSLYLSEENSGETINIKTTYAPDTGKKIAYIFDIKEQIAPPVWHKAQKAFSEAKTLHARIIIIHMNTYGGLLESADSLRTIILNSEIPVYVFIDNNAASAGALISIACDSIYMSPGANIGAATVVDQQGKPLPDKYQSYMRSMMRSTAEAKGRDPDIAQAMVDPRIKIEGITDTGQVLTFTTSEAIEFGFCEGEAVTINQVLTIVGAQDHEVVELKLSTIDKIIGFLVNPIVSGILIMLIIGGIYFELQSPGIGFPLAAAILAALLYFAPLYLEGLAEHWEILLFIAGVILIAVEIFVIPGFGVAGISGIVLVLVGLTLSMVGNIGFSFPHGAMRALISSFFIVVIATFLALLISFYLSRKILTTHAFGHLALDTVQDKEDGYTSADKIYASMIGKQGKTYTILRPSGKIIIDDEIFDATALTSYIDKGEDIEVVKYANAQLFVRKIVTSS